MTNFSGKNLDRSADREAANPKEGVSNKGSGYPFELERPGAASVVESSDGKLSINVPINLKYAPNLIENNGRYDSHHDKAVAANNETSHNFFLYKKTTSARTP